MINFKTVFSGLSIIFAVACTSRVSEEPAVFHAGPAHLGYYGSTGIPVLHGIKWKFKTAGRVFSSPVIRDDIVFTGSDDGYLYALNSRDGSLLWKFRTSGRVSSTPAVYDHKVYMVSFDGYAYCLSQETGKEIWNFKTAGERVFAAPGIHGIPEKDRNYEDPWDMFLSSPVVADGNVYFGCGYGVFYALDCNTGLEKWKYKTNGVIHSSPACSDSTVYFGSWDSYLYALNSKNGSLKWKFKTGIDTVYFNQAGFQSSPVVYKDIVYSGCRDAHIWAIDAKTGKQRWNYYNNGSWVIVTPAIHSDTLWFTTSDTHKLIALNALDGKQLYIGNCKTFGFSSPAITDGIVYLGNFGGSLMAFKSANGEPVWEFRTGAAVSNKDSILTNTGEFNFQKIFKENSYRGSLEAVKLLYSIGSILSSPAIDNGIIYFGSTDSSIYALN